MRYAALDVPDLGDLRLVADAADIPPGCPRGRVWTNEELAHLRTVSPDQQEARAIAACKEILGGVVVGARMGDRGPAVALELHAMPHNTPTAKTRRYLDRGHGPKPGPQNFTLGGTTR